MDKIPKHEMLDYEISLNLMKAKKNSFAATVVQKELMNIISKTKNPHVFLIYCLRELEDQLPKIKPGDSSFIIIKVFLEFMKYFNILPGIPDEYLKDIFQLLKKSKKGTIKDLIKIFNFKEKKDLILPLLKSELENEKFCFSSTMCTELGLQKYFEVEELLVPTYFSGFDSQLNDMLNGDKSQAEKLAAYLEQYLEYLLNSDITIKIPKESLQKRKNSSEITKYLISLIKKYDLNVTDYPSIQFHQSTKTIRFLSNKFDSGSITRKSYLLFLRDIALDLPRSQNFIMNCILKEGLNFDDLSLMIDNYPDIPESLTNQQEAVCNDSTKYYQLPLTKEAMIYICDREFFHTYIDEILKDQDTSCYGIDCEWHPSLIFGDKEQLSIVQIASESKVYIFDIHVLSKQLESRDWDIFGQIFSQLQFVGYDFKSDAKILSSIDDKLAYHIKNSKGLIDLFELKSRILSLMFKYSNKNESGLSGLVTDCFGIPLNKKYQLSYWLLRPLDICELTYAALDAYCLVKIKKYLDDVCKELRIVDYDHLKSIDEYLPPTIKNKPLMSQKILSTNKVKFACDSVFENLARFLRHCNIDTEIFSSYGRNDLRKICKTFYIDEKRIILTESQTHKKIRNIVPVEFLYSIQCENFPQQLKEVLHIFNIKVQQSDTFGRCADCNGDILVSLPPDMVKLLIQPSGNEDGRWVSIQGGQINCAKKILHNNVIIKISDVPNNIINKEIEICVCTFCGKCYYEGSHHAVILENMINEWAIKLR